MAGAVLAHFGLTLHQQVGVGDGGGHQHVGFVGGVAKHQALVTSALLQRIAAVNTLIDVRGLLADCVQHGTRVSVEAHVGVGVADVTHCIAHYLFDINPGRGGHFTRYHDHAGLDQGLTGDTGLGILLEDGVQHRIGDLVGNLVGMAFGDRLGSKQLCHDGILSLSGVIATAITG